MNIDRYLKFNLVFIALVGVALLLTSQKSRAQSDHYLSLSNGLQRNGERDYGYSPLKYAGIRSLISLEYGRNTPNRSASLALNFAKGGSNSVGDNLMDSWSFGLISHTIYHKELKVERGFHMGWSLQSEFNQRLHQSFSNFNNRMDYFTSVGPTMEYLFPISVEDVKLGWKTTAHVQAIGLKVASDYISSKPQVTELFGGKGESTWYAADVFRVGRDWSVGCLSELRYESNSGNSLAIQHQFDFQQLSVVQEVIRVRNSFLLNICVRL